MRIDSIHFVHNTVTAQVKLFTVSGHGGIWPPGAQRKGKENDEESQ